MKKYLLLIALFIGSKSFAQTIPNAGLDSWTNLIFFYEPTGFVTSNYASLLLGTGGLPTANVSRSSSIKLSGTYAAKLNSYAQNVGDTSGIPGLMITGELDLTNAAIKPGFPISNMRPESLKGYYRYEVGNRPDSGIVSVALTKYDTALGSLNVIGAGVSFLSATNTFTEFNVPIIYTSEEVPDTAILIFSTTSTVSLDTTALSSAPINCTMYIDELSFVGNLMGVQPIDKLIEAALYPNPSASELNVSFHQQNASEANVKLINIEGKVVYETTKNLKAGNQTLKLDVSNVNAGMYQVLILTADGTISKKVAVIK